MRSTSFAVLVATIAVGSTLDAQTAMLTGTVIRGSAGQGLGGAEVSLPSLARTTTTNYVGEFRFDRLPAGRYTVTIRRLGFAPFTDTVSLSDGARVDREFALEERPQRLDTVVAAAAAKKYISPGLSEFEERRKAGFGHFIAEEDLRKEDNREMTHIIISHVPGLTRFRVPPNSYYVGTTRKCAAGPELINCKPGAAHFCPVTLYIDGLLVYNAANGTNVPPPDLASFQPNQYAGIEFYNGGATMPLKYNSTSSGCGTLLLWTRER